MQRSSDLAWLACVLLAGANCAGNQGSRREHAPEQTAERALDFELPDTNGQRVRLDSTRGDVVLVDLWATWCAPCAESLPFYADLQRRYAEKGLRVFAVSVDESDADVAEFLAKHPLALTILRDPQGTLPQALDLQAMPTLVLIDRDGRVHWKHEGFIDADRAVIEKQLLALLTAPAASYATP